MATDGGRAREAVRPGGRASRRPERDLALLAASRGATQLGNMATVVAVVLVVEPLGPTRVALVLAAELVAVVLAAPVAGLVVDRWPARRLLVVAALVQSLAIGVGSLVVAGPQQQLLPGLVAVLLVVGSMQALAGPAQQALVPWVVGEDRSARGYATLAVAGNVGFLLGLPLGGLLVGTMGAPWALRVDAATFLLQAVVVLLLTAERDPRTLDPRTGQDRDDVVGSVPRSGPTSRGWAAGALAGAAWIRRDPVLLVSTVGLAVGLLAITTVNVAEVFVVVDVLGAGPVTYGLVAAAWAAASLVCSWLAGRLRDPGWTARWVLLGCVVTGGGLVLAGVGGLVTSLAVLVVGWVLGGAGNGATVVASSSLVRLRTPEERRGRVFAAVLVLYQAANVSALGLGAALVGLLGAAETLVVCGLAAGLAGAAALLLLRRHV